MNSVAQISNYNDLDYFYDKRQPRSACVYSNQKFKDVAISNNDAKSERFWAEEMNNMDYQVDQIIELTHPDNKINKLGNNIRSKRK
jgi:hypothetical protein